MNKKFILCGCEGGGVEFLSVVGKDKVAYFCDDKYQSKIVEGVEVISFQELKEIYKAYQVVVTNAGIAANFVEKLNSNGIPYITAFGGTNLFSFWYRLYRLSLIGMNIGGGGDCFASGEANALNVLKSQFLTGGGRHNTLFDVGANVGKYTLMLANMFPNASIHSFEPGKTTFAMLTQNISESTNKSNITLNNFGLSDKISDANLFYDRAGSGLASVYQRQLDYLGIDFSKSESIHLDTLDNYCDSKKISNIDFLKIDVEGNELNVFKGASKMLEARKIRNIQIEFGGCNLDSRTYFRDFWNLLHKNYHVLRIMRDGLVEIRNYEEVLEIFTTTNFFFHERT